VRRLFALLDDASKVIVGLPRDWTRVLPKEAPLTTVERWEQAFPMHAHGLQAKSRFFALSWSSTHMCGIQLPLDAPGVPAFLLR
jgi:hypothetical protein